MSTWSCSFSICTWTRWPVCFKKIGVKLELWVDTDMLLMVGIGIRGRTCYAIHRHAKANNKYMKNYNKNTIIPHVFRCK